MSWLTAAGALLSGAMLQQAGDAIPFLPGLGESFPSWGDDDKKKRRRRRRALTQGDRNDIAFVAATINKTVAGAFAVQLATRSR